MVRDAEALGRRVTAARRSAGLTQQEVAADAQLDRSALAKIESGKRRVTALELAGLADALAWRIEWFLEDPPPSVLSRRNAADPGAPSPTIDQVVERVAREVEYVRELGRGPDVGAAPPSLDTPTSDDEAEAQAAKARALLGYGQFEPAVDLAARAAEVGLLAFVFDLGAEAADGASLLLGSGGIAVLNGARRPGRRRFTLAHELGHYLFADAFSTDWRVADERAGHREARIDRFARALLLPAGALGEAWVGHRETDRDVRTTAVLVASEFLVDMATLARRLRETGLAQPGEESAVRSARTTKADIVEHDLLIPRDLEPPELPPAYAKAVLKAFRSEQVSTERALALLFDTWQEDDLPELPKLPEQAIWSFVS